MDKRDVNVEYKSNFVTGHTCNLTHVPSGIKTSGTDFMSRGAAYRKAMNLMKINVMRWERRYQ